MEYCVYNPCYSSGTRPQAKLNLSKHGVSFNEARTVFDDDEALWIADPDHSHAEERFIQLGTSCSFRLLVVVHCERTTRGSEEVIRIISSRKATRREINHYHQGLP